MQKLIYSSRPIKGTPAFTGEEAKKSLPNKEKYRKKEDMPVREIMKKNFEKFYIVNAR